MITPSPAMGYARRKPYTGNWFVRFDEEGMAAMPFLYSTKNLNIITNHLFLRKSIKSNNYFYL